jgi:ankyrin repeat protein
VKSWAALIPMGLLQDPAAAFERYDEFGNTRLHAFISHVATCKEQASEVQKHLEGLLQSFEDGFNALYMRDRVGLTPLHIAIRLSLPHVAGILLLRVA